MIKRKIIPAVILVIAAGVFIYSGYKLLSRQTALNKGGSVYSAIAADVVSAPETSLSDPSDPDGTAPVEVDFKALAESISGAVGWLYSEGTPISYPVMQASDNDYYLRRLPDGTYNICGSIFMDHRCTADFSTFNTMIYGHSFHGDDNYFGSLSKYSDQAYYDGHKVFYFITPSKAYTCRVFSGFVTDGVSSVYNIPGTREEILEYIAYAREHSDFESDVKVTPDDRIILLSTCSYAYDNARYVIFAKIG